MQTGYKHHVFVSYSRSGEIKDWVHNHFFPVLERRMDSVLEESPELYIDRQIEVGSDWPHALAEALHHSCCLLAIWSPSFFRSKWCLAEWETMLAREQQLGLKEPGRPRGLVYPVVFSNGKSFPDEARRTQHQSDLRDYAYPYPQFKDSMKYLDFHDRMTKVAEDLTTLFRDTPPWDSGWPTIRPPVKPPQPPQFQRL